MQIGIIKDKMVAKEYIKLIDGVVSIAVEMKNNPAHEEYVSELDLIISTLHRVKTAAEQGRVVNDIAGITKFASDWSIEKGRLTFAVWEVENYFKKYLYDEQSFHEALSQQQQKPNREF